MLKAKTVLFDLSPKKKTLQVPCDSVSWASVAREVRELAERANTTTELPKLQLLGNRSMEFAVKMVKDITLTVEKHAQFAKLELLTGFCDDVIQIWKRLLQPVASRNLRRKVCQGFFV
jgi:hypothetical protein